MWQRSQRTKRGLFVLCRWVAFVPLAKMCGEAEAERVCKLSSQAMLDLKSFSEKNAIDAELRLDGWLWTAISKVEGGSWDATVQATHHRGASFEAVAADPLPGRSGAHLGGVFERVSASVQPARFARSEEACGTAWGKGV